MTLSTVTVQTTPLSQPSTPGWMGEVAAFAQILNQTSMLTAIAERARFARARMGTYELIDFVAVLIGYALSGEPTLRAFYDRLIPFANVFMALFGRSGLPSRSALSRYLSALDQASVESLRTLFQEDLLARTSFADPGGIKDRCEQCWLVADVDGTRKVARQRALPQHESLPAPHRRFEQVCAKGYQGRKRGEVVRTRTVVLQAHTHQDLGNLWRGRQWRLPRRAPACYPGSPQLCQAGSDLAGKRRDPPGWLVWQCRSALGCADLRPGADRTKQGLPVAGSLSGTSRAGSATCGNVHAPRKPGHPHAL